MMSDNTDICEKQKIFKIWILNGSDLINLKTLSIGKNISKYSKFEIKEDHIIETLKLAYETGKYNNIDIIKNTLEFLNIPRTNFSQIEHMHRVKRETLLKHIYTIYPDN